MSKITDLFLIRETPYEERETETKTQTQTQTKTEPDLSAYVRGMNAQKTENVPQERERETDVPELKRANATVTARKMADIELSPEAGEKLSFLQRLGLEDDISDEEAADIAGASATGIATGTASVTTHDTAGVRPQPTTPENLPAVIEKLPDVINKEVTKETNVEPEWHQVKNLPGYLKNQIRALGRQVFGSFTNTKIEDIQIIANVGGSGPNTKRELNAVAGWLKDNGKRDTDGEINFQQSIPDYDADFEIYTAKNFTFMVVKDEYGNYIYSWPSNDTKLLN